ncbi:MAG: LacI family DNA-binding transcriptional regulator [Beutenbergiaceae bacterium]
MADVSAHKRPGMTDVARLAGVSHQTVSRVLNDHPSVRPQTRERVLAAIDSLGYRRNRSARALVTSRSGLIGIVTSGSSHSGPAGTLGALEQAARAAGYFATVAVAPEPDPQLHAEIAGAFVEQGVEGVIVIAPTPGVAEVAEGLRAEVPVLVVSARPPTGTPTISLDQAGGAGLAAEYLADLGHTDVVHISGPPDWFDATARSAGWHSSLSAAGIAARPDLRGDWSSARGYAVGQQLLSDLPTAVFAANDLTALGVLRVFAEAGVRVPQDVSVIGFDDLAGASDFYPPLTTVRQDLGALGVAAVSSLIEAIAGEDVDHRLLEPELIVRASTAIAQPRH